MRFLGIDHGTVRIGLALSDPLGILASPLATIQGDPEEQALSQISLLVRQHSVTTLVIGLPLHLDDTPSPASRRVMAFVEKLLKLTPGCEVQYVDERLSSREAKERLAHKNKRGRTRPRDEIDRTAAVIILQDYLDQQQGMALLPEEPWD